MTVCRCCGQTLPRSLHEELPLSPIQRAIADAVLAAGEYGIEKERLLKLASASSMDGLRVQIVHTNKKLLAIGKRISSNRSWGAPYIYGAVA